MKKSRAKYVWLTVCAFFSWIVPPLAVVVMKWREYTDMTPEGNLRLGAGLLVIFILLLRHLGWDKHGTSMSLAAWGFPLSWTMSAAMTDLPMLCAAWLFGRGCYYVFFETALGRAKERYKTERGMTHE